jgi:hypothetical protein
LYQGNDDDAEGTVPVKTILLALTLLAGFATSACVPLLAAAGGATAVACTEEELNCPVD